MLFRSSQVFSSVYTTSTSTWSDPASVADLETFTSRPHHQSLSLFTNGAGDAGIAINHVKTEGATKADDVHDVIVRRYNASEGWLSSTTVGSGCTGSLRECTRRPRGAILDSGEAAVVFIDQDENDYYRLKATTFSAE